MANKITDMLKADGTEAAYRVASTQIASGVKAALIKLFASKGGDGEKMEMFKLMLDSEVGESIIALILGYGLNYAPGISANPKVIKLAEEFRTQGMTVAGNMVVGAAMESFLPVLTSALSALPEETSSAVRVSHEEEEEEVVSSIPSKRTAGR